MLLLLLLQKMEMIILQNEVTVWNQSKKNGTKFVNQFLRMN